MEKGITIRELAKKCNTSIATISRVLNGNYNPNKPGHREIKELIEKSGYAPQKVVKNLKNILCVMNYEPMREEHKFLFMKSVEELAALHKFNVVLSHTHEPEHLEKLIRACNIKGIIFISVPLAKPSVPAVLLNQDYMGGEYSSVDCYDFAGLVTAFKYLKENGHKRIAYFSNKEDNVFEINPRQVQIPAVYKAAGVEFDSALVYHCAFEQKKYVFHIEKCVKKLMSLKIPPTAIMLSGDIYAADFYHYLNLQKLKIPEDISLIGFDDFPLALELNPKLTDIRKQFSVMAAEALKLLEESMSGGKESVRKVMVKPELIIRNSVRRI